MEHEREVVTICFRDVELGIEESKELFAAVIRQKINEKYSQLLNRGMSIQDLADKAGMSKNIFINHISIPTDIHLSKLARIGFAMDIEFDFSLIHKGKEHVDQSA